MKEEYSEPRESDRRNDNEMNDVDVNVKSADEVLLSDAIPEGRERGEDDFPLHASGAVLTETVLTETIMTNPNTCDDDVDEQGDAGVYARDISDHSVDIDLDIEPNDKDDRDVDM